MTRAEARARSQDNGGARRPVLRSSSFGDTAVAAGHVGPSFIVAVQPPLDRSTHPERLARNRTLARVALDP